MKRPKPSTIILSLLLVGSNLFWFYGAIDQGVTLMYAESSYQTAQSNYKQLLVLANKELIGLTASEAIAWVGKDNNGLEPFTKEGCLYVGQICLRLNSENVISGYEENAL